MFCILKLMTARMYKAVSGIKYVGYQDHLILYSIYAVPHSFTFPTFYDTHIHIRVGELDVDPEQAVDKNIEKNKRRSRQIVI